MPFQRQCPECGETLIYANLPGYERARRLKSLCRKCGASPSIIQRRLKEKQESRAAEESTFTFMREFFEMVTANISESRAEN
jgi:ribosomal protein S27AE